MSKKNDPFEKVPEFLAMFKRISNEGFFSDLQLNIQCFEEGKEVLHFSLKGTGLVPNNPKWARRGIAILVDPKNAVAKARAFLKDSNAVTVHMEIKTEDWKLWDKTGNEVIGSKGTRTTFILHIFPRS